MAGFTYYVEDPTYSGDGESRVTHMVVNLDRLSSYTVVVERDKTPLGCRGSNLALAAL